MPDPVPVPLDEASLVQALADLSRRDPDLARIFQTLGAPPMWSREPGFATLLLIMLEQQVSLASAAAAFRRLLDAASPLTPQSFLRLDDDALKAIGFSRQKIVYGRHLAHSMLSGSLNLDALVRMDDGAAKAELMKIKGIGSWTADIYLLRALGRPDIWPGGDLALAIAVQQIKGLPARPSASELDAISAVWRPWRAVAARLLWHYYLHRPAPRQSPKMTAQAQASQES
jgi:DNA-3-methyladenine glycosylase II